MQVSCDALPAAPLGAGTEGQPAYLNAVGAGESDLAPDEILRRLQAIERAAGRTRPYPNAPRTLDLDLVLSGDEILETEDLQVPHPRFRERRFVLGPLATIAADLADPVTGLTVRDLLARLAD